jgi:23S rRNA (cytidine1920-2'-O)/16S rRNA (cytidine1409-2'-O)-methyltransferase
LARERLDRLLVDRGLAESRERAQAMIMAGIVRVDGAPARRAALPVAPEAEVEVKGKLPYVSRGGVKLAHALDHFGVDPSGQVLADVGASTGGFTDCLLQRGARTVYAVDVGYGQLDYRLRQDERVVVMERTHARDLERLPEPVDGATVDVSFISLRQVLPSVFRWQRPGAWTIALVKPQFEAGREQVGKGGVVRDPAVHEQVLARVEQDVRALGREPKGHTASPILGPAGNREFLLLIGAADAC